MLSSPPSTVIHRAGDDRAVDDDRAVGGGSVVTGSVVAGGGAPSRAARRTRHRAPIVVERWLGDIVLIRVSGVCTRATAASLLRLTDLHADLATADPPHRRELVAVLVDLEDTTGLAEDALRLLRRARSRARWTGFTFALTGCRAWVHRLPLPVQQLLAGFSTYPTVDAALVALSPTPRRDRAPV